MVTPLRDGMNLVAKEYVAAQDAEDPGVLVLSQFAGAAEELTEALIVNPYNIEETADVIRAALEMPLAERRARHDALMAAVRKHDVASWSQSFLSQLDRVRSVEDPATWRAPEPIRTALAKLEQVMGRRPMGRRPRAASRKPKECQGLRAGASERDRVPETSSVK
jgi:trehalose 6-phosphate synthase